jgi:hypothetical protein
VPGLNAGAFIVVGALISIDTSKQQYKRHTGGSWYLVMFKARHCWLALDSESKPRMTGFIVFLAGSIALPVVLFFRIAFREAIE